jgi:hypothetical protein
MDIEGVVKEVHLMVPHFSITWTFWTLRMPKASRKCGPWKEPAARSF